MEVVHEDVFHFFCISFMWPDTQSSIWIVYFLTQQELLTNLMFLTLTSSLLLIQKYALATIDDGKIVRTWRCLLSEKLQLTWYS